MELLEESRPSPDQQDNPAQGPPPKAVKRPRRRARPIFPARELTREEIAKAIDESEFPAVLTVEQAAKLFQLSTHTMYRAVSQGRYRDAVRRGKPLRFFRDRLIVSFFSEGSD